jgi:enoyl-CoA hydratase/carnithine racemase
VLGGVADLSKPTIAMLQGDAVGGGLFMALACDLRVAASHARFGVPVARTLGNFPTPSNLARLFACIGIDRTREILLTARLFSADEARAIGLVHEVHPADELEQQARALATRLCELAPLTLAGVKEAARRTTRALTIPDADEILLSCYLSQDFQEGVRAFLEKRTPRWQGQ